MLFDELNEIAGGIAPRYENRFLRNEAIILFILTARSTGFIAEMRKYYQNKEIPASKVKEFITHHYRWTRIYKPEILRAMSNSDVFDMEALKKGLHASKRLKLSEKGILFVLLQRVLQNRRKELRAVWRDAHEYSNVLKQQKAFDEYLPKALQEINPHIKKYVRNKLYFLTKFGYIDQEDVISELKTHCVWVAYNLFPRIQGNMKSGLKAYLVASVKNHGINIIDRFTNKKRANTVTDTGGKVHVLQESYEEMLEHGDDTLLGTYDSDMDARITANSLFNQVKTPRQKHFLQLVAGIYDQGFTHFLAKNGIKVDNEAYTSRHGTDYVLPLIADYLQVNIQKLKSLMDKLKNNYPIVAIW